MEPTGLFGTVYVSVNLGKVRAVRQKSQVEQGREMQGEHHLLANSAVPDACETSADPLHLHALALRLIGELSACVQRVSSDLAQARDAHDATDLELARQRWAQQLRAVADLAAGHAPGQHTSLLPSETPLHALPPYPRRAGTTQPITATTRALVASANDQAPETMPVNPPLPATYRWVPLTVREREVLRLWQRGYSPRRIALRLVISVETVYTHTRNIRRKQRAWEQVHLAQQTRLDAMK